MTGKERLTALLENRPVDRPSWTTLVDDRTRSVMPIEWRTMPVLDFYRAIGCDIACFGNYGLPSELCVSQPCRRNCPQAEETTMSASDGTTVSCIRTPWGELRMEWMNGHPTRHPVQTIEDLRVLKSIWRNSRYEETPRAEIEWQHDRVVAALGNDGIYIYALDPSPVQDLLEFEMGVNNFCALWADYPEEIGELLDVMHERRREEFDIAGRLLPCRAVVLVENTSTTMVSPTLYERFSLPQLRDYADILHRHGKLMILHMCGHIRALLPLIKCSGADGINATTPSPVGNTRYEEVLDVMGENTLLWGAMMDPTVFQAPLVTREQLIRSVKEIFTPRLRRARFLLWAAADGLPTPVERFLAIRDGMRLLLANGST